MSAPAAVASAAFSPTAKTATRAVLPVPCGRFTVPRTIWSALRGSTPSRMATSTVESSLTFEVSLARPAASSGEYRCSRSIFSAASRYALLRFITVLHSWISCGTGRAGSSHTCSATNDIRRSHISDLGDLAERQLDRRLAAEDRHQHLQLLAVRVDLVDGR